MKDLTTHRFTLEGKLNGKPVFLIRLRVIFSMIVLSICIILIGGIITQFNMGAGWLCVSSALPLLALGLWFLRVRYIAKIVLQQ